jgi:hypothetical protein
MRKQSPQPTAPEPPTPVEPDVECTVLQLFKHERRLVRRGAKLTVSAALFRRLKKLRLVEALTPA